MKSLIVRHFTKPLNFETSLQRMQSVTAASVNDHDEIWLLEHPSVYTLGLAGEEKHIITSLPHPIIRCDRGGQITFHGPGQIICYLLIDLKKSNLSIIDLVDGIETVIIETLRELGINAEQNSNIGRGVFVSDKKIASIGIKVKKYKSYHGFALNYNVDLKAFRNINPCGHENLGMTNITSHVNTFTKDEIHTKIINHCYKIFHYDSLVNYTED